MSAEAPIPVLNLVREFDLPGMGGNVASNLTALGVAVDGPLPDGPLPVKHRLYTSDGIQLARWDESDKCDHLQLSAVEYWLEEYAPDLALIADYRKGAITYEAIARITTLARELDVPLFIDTKGNPADYLHDGIEGTLFFPNASEYEKYQREYSYIPHVLLKQGADGMTLLSYGEPQLHVPSQARFVRCVNGAGDTVLAAYAAAYLAGLDARACFDYASFAAANVVEQPFDQRTPLDCLNLFSQPIS